tara:strand:- start:201 stop:329 length:129 start_codon:yes stop_codon:yes gene_type:complete
MSRQVDQFAEFLSNTKNQSSEQSHKEAVKMAERVEKQKRENK